MNFRTLYLLDHAIEFWLGIAAVVGSLAFFIDPGVVQRSAIGALHPYDYVWNGLYLLGGLALSSGLAALSPRLQGAGLVLLATTATTQLVAVIALLGWAGLSSELVLGLLAAACLARLRPLL